MLAFFAFLELGTPRPLWRIKYIGEILGVPMPMPSGARALRCPACAEDIRIVGGAGEWWGFRSVVAVLYTLTADWQGLEWLTKPLETRLCAVYFPKDMDRTLAWRGVLGTVVMRGVFFPTFCPWF